MTSVSFTRHDGHAVPAVCHGEAGLPGIIVVQEWWGVDAQVIDHAAKIASHGYRTLIPDLYRGKVGVDAEEAHHLMSNLNFPLALEDIRAAAAYLLSTGSPRVGVIGFCMGGALALGAVLRIDEVVCAAPFYGVNFQLADPTLAPAGKAIQAHFGATDTYTGFSDLPTATKLREELGKSPAAAQCQVIVHEGVGHAFMNSRSEMQARRAAAGHGGHRQDVVDTAWAEVFAFFGAHLKA